MFVCFKVSCASGHGTVPCYCCLEKRDFLFMDIFSYVIWGKGEGEREGGGEGGQFDSIGMYPGFSVCWV